jgi:hypothetical protein
LLFIIVVVVFVVPDTPSQDDEDFLFERRTPEIYEKGKKEKEKSLKEKGKKKEKEDKRKDVEIDDDMLYIKLISAEIYEKVWKFFFFFFLLFDNYYYCYYFLLLNYLICIYKYKFIHIFNRWTLLVMEILLLSFFMMGTNMKVL